VGEQNGKGVRIRQYTAEEVHQLYEHRELLEGGVVRAATDIDIARLV
jgi:DNA-binding GntR family transcriptional regulator